MVIKNIKIIGFWYGGFILDVDEETINNLKETSGIVKKYGNKAYMSVTIPMHIKNFDITNSIWNGDDIDVEIYSAEVYPGKSIQKLYFMRKHINQVSKREEELKNKGKKFIDDFKDILPKDQLFEILEEYILKED